MSGRRSLSARPRAARPEVGIPTPPVTTATPTNAGPGDAAPLTAAAVSAVHTWLVESALPASETDQIDLLRTLEELRSAVTAVQASAVLAVDASARADQARAGVPVERCGRDVPVRLGLALRESPARARSFLGAARAWHTEMPHTLAALRSGRLSPWRATLLVKETAHLPVELREQVDAEICADPHGLDGLGTAALVGRVKRRASELDPASAAARARRAASERAVWIRPAPDTMAYVTALLPVAQGVGVHAALRRAADTAVASGEPRSRGQIMADTLVERVTGQASADAVPVTVNLVMSDATLLGAGQEPGLLVDGAAAVGAVPAQVARNLLANALDADAAWVRRLYADPRGHLVAASSTARFFADGLGALLRVRDQGLCRTPYCDAPVRQLDHVVPDADGGPTDLDNGQGLCEACNQAKNSGALAQHVARPPGARHTVVTTTSTGHRYASTAPPPPRPAARSPRVISAVERRVERQLAGRVDSRWLAA